MGVSYSCPQGTLMPTTTGGYTCGGTTVTPVSSSGSCAGVIVGSNCVSIWDVNPIVTYTNDTTNTSPPSYSPPSYTPTPIYSCPSGYTLQGTQCVYTQTIPATPNYSCPSGYTLVGTACISNNPRQIIANVTYTCPSGYILNGNQCISNIFGNPYYNVVVPVVTYSCPSDYTLSNPQVSLGGTLAVTTSNGSYCYIAPTIVVGTSSNPNQFTYSGISQPSTTDTSNVNPGYTSFYYKQVNLVADTYTIVFAAGNMGWLYINDNYIGSSGLTPTEFTYTSAGGTTSFFIAAMNAMNTYSSTGASIAVINSSGQTVLTTDTTWQYSLDPSDFGSYEAICPNGYTFNSQLNACIATPDSTNSCPAGYVVECTPNSTTPIAPTITYTCPNSLWILNSTTNTCTQKPITATITYSCPSGYTLQGTQCSNGTNTIAATTNYSCPSGYILNGTQCVSALAVSATQVTTCPENYTLVNNQCQPSRTITPVANYACPSGFTLQGSICISTNITFNQSLSCPPGFTLQGTACIPSSINAYPVYSCPSGYTLQGTQCSNGTTTIDATVAYTCPPGTTLSGTTCYGSTTVTCPNYPTGSVVVFPTQKSQSINYDITTNTCSIPVTNGSPNAIGLFELVYGRFPTLLEYTNWTSIYGTSALTFDQIVNILTTGFNVGENFNNLYNFMVAMKAIYPVSTIIDIYATYVYYLGTNPDLAGYEFWLNNFSQFSSLDAFTSSFLKKAQQNGATLNRPIYLAICPPPYTYNSTTNSCVAPGTQSTIPAVQSSPNEIILSFYNSSNSLLSSVTLASQAVGWQFYSASTTVPISTSYATVTLSAIPYYNSMGAAFSRIKVENSNVATPFSDDVTWSLFSPTKLQQFLV